jgi:hypothetical protein
MECGISEDLADLLFHAAPMAPRPAPQPCFHVFFNVPHY